MAKMAPRSGRGRRHFLAKVAALGVGAPAVVASGSVNAATQNQDGGRVRLGPQLAASAESEMPTPAKPLTAGRPGADYMVDVIKSLNIEYVAAVPGSSFRGLH